MLKDILLLLILVIFVIFIIKKWKLVLRILKMTLLLALIGYLISNWELGLGFLFVLTFSIGYILLLSGLFDTLLKLARCIMKNCDK